MSSHNAVGLHGKLIRDPELQAVGDKYLCKFSIAHNSGFGEKKKVSYFDCEAWGKTGEVINNHLGKGDPIIFQARAEQDRWTDKEGNNRSKVKFVLSSFMFLGKKNSNESQDQPKFNDLPKNDNPFSDDDVPF
ncbi:MAG: single-stranded DNA-binding protein [Gammaproteobacteria bacterium]|nr:single-stranded DNA-binding protein [Gammaproteobacteria bacterium]